MGEEKVLVAVCGYKEKDIINAIENENRDILCSILAVNIDNFCKVNETFGRDEGDRILVTIYNEIHQVFRGTDIIIHLKGDEFIIFNQNIGMINNAEVLAENLLYTVSKIKLDNNCRLTASIGITVFPIHGRSYEELKNKAYQSMYSAKSSGKNCFRLYDSARTKALYHEAKNNNKYLYDIITKKNYETEDIDTKLGEIAIHILYEDRNIISALDSIVELVCMYLGFSRTYVRMFGDSNIKDINGVAYNLPGYESGAETEALQLIREDLISRLFEEYHEVKLLNIHDDEMEANILEYMKDQKLNDLLFFPIIVGNNFMGAAIFENQSNNIIDFQVETLKELEKQLNIVKSYISNIHSKKKKKEYISKLEMLDNMDAYVYIVDKNNYEITFLNRKALKTCDIECIGKKCYKLINNCDSPCKDCPLKLMNDDNLHASYCKETYNYATRKWTKNLYSWMDTRDNNGKCIIISVDINEYFEE